MSGGQVGQEIVIHGRVVGAQVRVAVILAVHGPDGPYRVRFPDGTETVLFPGPDAEFRSAPASR
ncbi:DUF1918 domain-containing protein [Actinomycetospora endophytica]|uniref:DUF1918 domain-containing protein n=1 Tax=Actinomycetospora endophytica TaxID=2291215 RepID=A0ABS8PCW9_9PSEU|nr:DUF1918 domain-containing protein [Actinomycetospora endophytica]MCD2196124.1 DUF1918 domain-containing protein [Actinomycetospora endophytica]